MKSENLNLQNKLNNVQTIANTINELQEQLRTEQKDIATMLDVAILRWSKFLLKDEVRIFDSQFGSIEVRNNFYKVHYKFQVLSVNELLIKVYQHNEQLHSIIDAEL